MRDTPWDAIIVGGGPAGLSAALMLGRSRRRVLVVDAGEPRNRFAAHMHGVLGHEGLPPQALAARGRAEAEGYGVTFRGGRVERVTESDGLLRVGMPGADVLETRALVVATGISDELQPIAGLAQRWGTSVLHCPYCHGWEVRDQRLGVLLTSPAAVHQAELVRQLSRSVTVFTGLVGRLDSAIEARLASRGVVVVDSPVVELRGVGGELSDVRTEDGAIFGVDALFTTGAPLPHDQFLGSLALARADTPAGTVLEVDPLGRTSNPRVWAVGNVVAPYANVPSSIGTGSMTGAAVNAALTAEDFDLAVAEREGAGDVADAPRAPDSTAGPAGPAGPAEFWERRYGESGLVWSGRPNASLVGVASSLAPGSALDLGCGEGGDAIWLAQNGWHATGVDISTRAVRRASEAARAAGIPSERAHFTAADLASWSSTERFDLVAASFLQSPVALARTEIVRRAADRVVPGGHLLIVSHAAPPPWARHTHTDGHEGPRSFPTPDEELADLSLDEHEWQVVIAEVRARPATDPTGASATLDDTVVLLRRTG
ncbi:FAD-dependent oxidoreductase [Microbacterium sp. HA-8]|uniref:FAD-dependent oxidoreductase n=1 Tax=Microbacterium sp. HA-8 TaxID=3234200 RepID=UPI0038F6A718